MAANKSLKVLKDRQQFLNLKINGKKLRVNHWMLLNLMPNDQGEFRCGWTLTRRTGRANVRNKIKRWCREFFRSKLNCESIPAVDLNVVFCNAGKDFYKNISHAEFNQAASRGWKKLEQFCKP